MTLLLSPYQKRINSLIVDYLPHISHCPKKLHAAMRYSLMSGGKRLRAALVYVAGQTWGASLPDCDHAALAVEYMHTYSLIHDDLPAMDNDDLRRGQPSCHIAFNEATAILAGDALQALAFEVLSQTSSHQPHFSIKMIHTLARSISASGMAGGQILDLEAENQAVTLNEVTLIHQLKTAALIQASVLLGAYCAGVEDAKTLDVLNRFGHAIGLAFQIQDDILDLESQTQVLGKPVQSDTRKHKATYPKVCGMSQSKISVQQHYQQALIQLDQLQENTEKLEILATLMVDREC